MEQHLNYNHEIQEIASILNVARSIAFSLGRVKQYSPLGVNYSGARYSDSVMEIEVFEGKVHGNASSLDLRLTSGENVLSVAYKGEIAGGAKFPDLITPEDIFIDSTCYNPNQIIEERLKKLAPRPKLKIYRPSLESIFNHSH